jgi:isoquinoline 1-oxidoreductase beta subunit
VAVIADTWWHAKTALDALPVEWDKGEGAKASSESIAKWLEEGLTAETKFVGNKAGDVQAAISGAAKKVEAVYAYPYQSHACMEPMNATALYTPDKCEVWTGTQNGEAAYAAAIAASGLPADKVDVHRLMLGTGFGRRTRSEYVTEAVLVAKQMPGTPIKLLKSREEDMTSGVYHPVTQCKLTGALDKDGNVTGLHMRISGQSILAYARPEAMQAGADPAVFQGLNPGGAEGAFGYDIPNLLIDHSMRNPHIPPWFWRGVNNNQNAIYLECFIDEMAHAAGKDPLEFRRAMLDRPDYLGVLKVMEKEGNWGQPLPAGRGRGMAIVDTYGTVTGQVAEVTVDKDGQVKVDRVVAVVDCYHAANPNTIAQQIEGGVIFGLSAVLYGEITFKNGAPVEGNFDRYRLLKMAETPKIEVHMPLSGGKTWGGIGEPSVAPVAPAVCNAIFAATGKRVRKLPLKNVDLTKA